MVRVLLCNVDTVFVSIHSHVYRCMSCGIDTEQKVNGVISFMPLTHSRSKTTCDEGYTGKRL